MTAGQVKRIVKEWVEGHRPHYPGLAAAHLGGSITTWPDDTPFPSHKDVDLHLIFAEGSPALKRDGLFSNNIEMHYQGLMLEAGVKSVVEYASAEAVLANPKIAHHLMVDSVLYDPSGLLRALQEPVAQDFARRRWVLARCAYERKGLTDVLAYLPLAQSMGPGGEVGLLGYSFLFIAAVLCVATLRPPTTGSRAALRMWEILSEQQRLDLYEEALTILGFAHISLPEVERLLAEGAEMFDLAVQVKKSPHPFGHKLHPHLRPYFVEACESLIAEGHYHEALWWLTPFYMSAGEVILKDGPDAQKPAIAQRQAQFLQMRGLAMAEARRTSFERAQRLFERFFALATDIVAKHPDIAD